MLRFAAAVRLISGLALVFSLAAVPTPVDATDGSTSVHTQVCDTTGAQITITKPASDSLVTKPDIQLDGTTQQTSQIEIYIDGNYNNSVSIPAGTSDFTTQITLQTGTHTIRVDANDTCQIKNGSDAVVLTYQPPVTTVHPMPPPHSGPSVALPVETVTYGPQLNNQASSGPSAVPPIFAPFVAPLQFFDVVPPDGTAPSFITLARIIGIIITVALLVFGWPRGVRKLLHIGVPKALPVAKKHLFNYGQITIRFLAMAILVTILLS
jgi:hypothetical protein